MHDRSLRSPPPANEVSGGEGSGVGGGALGNIAATRTTPHPNPPHHSLRKWGEGAHRVCGTCFRSNQQRTVVRLALYLLAAALAPGLAVAQGWPTERPIRLIVPFQAGSSSDSIGRIVAQRLSERLGQQIVIDNRVGASSMLG